MSTLKVTILKRDRNHIQDINWHTWLCKKGCYHTQKDSDWCDCSCHGKRLCPSCGKSVKNHSTGQIFRCMISLEKNANLTRRYYIAMQKTLMPSEMRAVMSRVQNTKEKEGSTTC